MKIRPNVTESIIFKNKKIHEQDNDLKEPAFSFSKINNNNLCLLNNCTNDEKLALLTHIQLLSTMTWKELRNISHDSSGFEKISYNSFNNKNMFNEFKDKDFLSTRFSGKSAMIGYRDKDIFFILCLDRKFKVYRH